MNSVALNARGFIIVTAALVFTADASCGSDVEVNQRTASGGVGGSQTGGGISTATGGLLITCENPRQCSTDPDPELFNGHCAVTTDYGCIYGDDPRIGCRKIQFANGFGEHCWPVDPSCDPIPDGECPPAERAMGSCQPVGLICTYEDASQCACVARPDGPEWRCAPAPAQGCPTCLPLCNECPQELEGLRCTYGLCEAGTRHSMVCSELLTNSWWWTFDTQQVPCAPECPASTPGESSPCPTDGLKCRYGDDPRPDCRPYALCGPTGGPWNCDATPLLRWLYYNAFCDPIPNGVCPTSPNMSGACDPSGFICSFSDGAQCACVDSLMGPEWKCVPPPAPGCPKTFPNEYEMCATPLEGLVCTYGMCEANTFAELECTQDNVWRATSASPCES